MTDQTPPLDTDPNNFKRGIQAMSVEPMEETIAIPVGAAGSLVSFSIEPFPIASDGGGGIAKYGDTSLSFSSSIFTEEVQFGTPDSSLTEGQYYINYLTGKGRGRKASTATSIDMAWNVLQIREDRNNSGEHAFLTNVSSVQDGVALNVSKFKNIVIFIHGFGSPNLTAKIKGSIADTEPDWGSSSNIGNPWNFIQSTDINNQASPTVGSTGIIYSGTQGVRMYQVDTSALEWINVSLTARVAGSIHAMGKAYSND